jgi:hypothetical protein
MLKTVEVAAALEISYEQARVLIELDALRGIAINDCSVPRPQRLHMRFHAATVMGLFLEFWATEAEAKKVTAWLDRPPKEVRACGKPAYVFTRCPWPLVVWFRGVLQRRAREDPFFLPEIGRLLPKARRPEFARKFARKLAPGRFTPSQAR